MNRNFSKYLFYYPATLMKGERVAGRLRDYRNFQHLSAEQIQEYQLEQLKKIVGFAYNNSSFYRTLYNKHGVEPAAIQKLSDIKLLPTVSKQDLASYANDIATFNRKPFLCSMKTTGGSTGRAVSIYKNASALARERAATWRSYEWAGIGVGSAQARFWGIPLSQLNRAKYRGIDFIANRIRFSAFEISDAGFGKFHKKIQQFKPDYLYGYTSVIEAYSVFIQRHALQLPASVKSILTTSEVLTADTRGTIESNTGKKVFNEYGCGEVGSIAHECEAGGLHVMQDNLLLEVEADEPNNLEGELIVTDFHNTAMPLIRYRVGDYGTLSSSPCPCGRGLACLESVHGRAYDMLLTENGEKIHPEYVMYIFEEIKDRFPAVRQFQVTQVRHDAFDIKLVKDRSYTSDVVSLIESRFREKFGPEVKIDFSFVSDIQREPSGKLRLIKNAMNG